MTERLPTLAERPYKTVLDGFLLVSHNADGTLKSAGTYSVSNVTTDRAYDANATTIDELSDVLGTLIADLRATGLIT